VQQSPITTAVISFTLQKFAFRENKGYTPLHGFYNQQCVSKHCWLHWVPRYNEQQTGSKIPLQWLVANKLTTSSPLDTGKRVGFVLKTASTACADRDRCCGFPPVDQGTVHSPAVGLVWMSLWCLWVVPGIVGRGWRSDQAARWSLDTRTASGAARRTDLSVPRRKQTSPIHDLQSQYADCTAHCTV